MLARWVLLTHCFVLHRMRLLHMVLVVCGMLALVVVLMTVVEGQLEQVLMQMAACLRWCLASTVGLRTGVTCC